jgi:hypothetical protein
MNCISLPEIEQLLSQTREQSSFYHEGHEGKAKKIFLHSLRVLRVRRGSNFQNENSGKNPQGVDIFSLFSYY